MHRAGVIGLVLVVLLSASPSASATGAEAPMAVGLWLKHAWMEEKRSAKELKALADHLTRNGATHVFVHIGPFDDEGRLSRYKPAVVKAWLSALKRHAPTVRRLAWLGGRARTSGGTVELASPAYRRAMVDETRELLERFDFDGIHLNIEPLEEADPDFPSLSSRRSEVPSARSSSPSPPRGCAPGGCLGFSVSPAASGAPKPSSASCPTSTR